MGTTERIFEMMKYLCQVRYTTMPALAEKFGVSTRTIKRDIDELGYLIPLEIKAGRYDGGIYVMEGYTWNKFYMSASDTELLIKIKYVAERQERLILDRESLQRLEKIIFTYSVPQSK